MMLEAQVELSHRRSYVGLYCQSNPDTGEDNVEGIMPRFLGRN
jgi:hypothetical protein